MSTLLSSNSGTSSDGERDRRTSAESTSGDESSFSPTARVAKHEWRRLGLDLADIPSARERFLCCVCGEVLGNDRERSLGNALRWRSWLLFTRRSVMSTAESCGLYCAFCQQSVCALCVETKKKIPDCKTLASPRANFQHDWILDRAVLPRTVCCECRADLPVHCDALRCVWCMRGVCLGCQEAISDSSFALCDLGRLRGALLLPWQVELPRVVDAVDLLSGFKVRKISRTSITGKGKLAAVVESMNLVILVVDRRAEAWHHLGRLLLHPLQVVECPNAEDGRPTEDMIKEVLKPFWDVLRQATVAVAGPRALATATLRAVRSRTSDAGAVVELETRSAEEFEEVGGAREELMDVARTKFSGVNVGVLRSAEVWRLRISSVDAGGVLIAADELYVSGWVNLEISGRNFLVQMNTGEPGQLTVREEELEWNVGNFSREFDGARLLAEIAKCDIDGDTYDLARRVGISDHPEESRSRLFQHRLRIDMASTALPSTTFPTTTTATTTTPPPSTTTFTTPTTSTTTTTTSPGNVDGWKIVLAFDFDRKYDGVSLRRPVEPASEAPTVTSVLSEFLHDTILAPILEGPSSSRSSLM